MREAVIRELYRQVETIGWESMSDRAKTKQYTNWVDDPLIGGELADSLTAEGIRVWLKDGPLKEYTRALEGIGSCAQYTETRLTHPSAMIYDALGSGWEIEPGSIREKPMHCLAAKDSSKRYVCWGHPQKFRDLQWAAVNHAVDSNDRPLIIVFVREGGELDDELRRRHERIAAHCQLDVFYTYRRLESAHQTPASRR
ncbi:hypothetical protein ABZ345_31180 [Lentzea sp. NPDC005914]|uniref:hypothetical protein n=1 Tax=Lentzea sp. NPDC005914 TaxID=3154572 RepID=UPI0033FAD069